MSNVVSREQCPRCAASGGDSSRDNLAVYRDGSTYCFACKYFTTGDSDGDSSGASGGSPIVGKGRGKDPARTPRGSTKDVPSWTTELATAELSRRGLTEESCRKFRVGQAGEGGIIFPYFHRGRRIAQHIRFPDKHFKWERGEGCESVKSLPLFGQDLWREGQRRLIITEGEIDAISVSQIQDHKWPVVSIPNGASSAVDSIRANYEYVSSFTEIVLCFDSDDPGQQAALKCAEILPPGKVYIATLPRKDANEMLMAKESQALNTRLWNAKPYRPDGIVKASEVKLKENISDFDVYEYPWSTWTKTLYGRRSGELLMFTSGSGLGKSTVLREMIKYDLEQGDTVGVLMLEEGVKDTIADLLSISLQKPVRKILAARKVNTARQKQGKEAFDFGIADDLDDKELTEAFTEMNSKGTLYLYDHFGSLESDVLISKMKYMAQALGCKKIYLDHISIVISGRESNNERKDIDVMMTNLRSFVQEVKVNVVAVSHLRKTDGKPYEEGGRITAQDLRGSGSIHQLSDLLLAFERDQQHPNDLISNTIVVRSLKDRFGGFTGILGALRYDPKTARLSEAEWALDNEGNCTFPGTDTPPFESMG